MWKNKQNMTTLSAEDRQLITSRYKELYKDVFPGHYLTMRLSKKGNAIVTHYIEEHCWTTDTQVRQVNVGNLEQLKNQQYDQLN